LYGLEAISAHNGWAMAAIGPLIVMTGLTILSIIISQLHKLVAIFDKKTPAAQVPIKCKGIIVPKVLPNDISETAEIYQQLIDTIEQPFGLKDLYQAAEDNDFPHPVLTATRFREAGILRPEGEGLFVWNR